MYILRVVGRVTLLLMGILLMVTQLTWFGAAAENKPQQVATLTVIPPFVSPDLLTNATVSIPECSGHVVASFVLDGTPLGSSAVDYKSCQATISLRIPKTFSLGTHRLCATSLQFKVCRDFSVLPYCGPGAQPLEADVPLCYPGWGLGGGGETTNATHDLSFALMTEIANLENGSLGINVPGQMPLAKNTIIEACVGTAPCPTASGFVGPGPVVSQSVPVSDYMTLHLYSNDPDAFDVRLLEPAKEEQLVAGGGYARWIWSLVPKRTGNQQLGLSVSLRLTAADRSVYYKDWIRPKPLPTVKVVDDLGYRLSSFFSENWKWIIGTLFGGTGVLGILWAIFKKLAPRFLSSAGSESTSLSSEGPRPAVPSPAAKAASPGKPPADTEAPASRPQHHKDSDT